MCVCCVLHSVGPPLTTTVLLRAHTNEHTQTSQTVLNECNHQHANSSLLPKHLCCHANSPLLFHPSVKEPFHSSGCNSTIHTHDDTMHYTCLDVSVYTLSRLDALWPIQQREPSYLVKKVSGIHVNVCQDVQNLGACRQCRCVRDLNRIFILHR